MTHNVLSGMLSLYTTPATSGMFQDWILLYLFTAYGSPRFPSHFWHLVARVAFFNYVWLQLVLQ